MPKRDRMAATARQVEALQHRARGLSYEQVGQALGITRQAAHKLVSQALDASLQEAGDQVRALELRRLDELLAAATAVLHRTHYYVQGGQVVEHDGAPLTDDGPVLAAVGQLVRLGESRRKLLGVDPPARVDVTLLMLWERSTEEQQLDLLTRVPPELWERALERELAGLEAELGRRGPPNPPAAETIADPEADHVAEAVAAGLAAAGVDLDQVDLDRVGDAVEAYLYARRRAGPSPNGHRS